MKEDFFALIGDNITDERYALDLAATIADNDTFSAYSNGLITLEQTDTYQTWRTRLYQKYVRQYHENKPVAASS